MPDFNKYASDAPYIRPQLPKTGLSLIVNPVYDYVNSFPKGVDWTSQPDTEDNSATFRAGIKNPFQGLGIVPVGPGASTSYEISKRYNDSDMMFMPTRDNEDLYAQHQGFWSSVGSGLGRLVLTTGTKLGTGIGYTAGLLGFGNKSSDYGTGFSAWLAGAGDNALAKWFTEAEDTIKEDWLPIYQEAADRNKGFFSRAATDLNFWTEDFSDGAAFLLSAFVPGMAISKIGLGTGVVRTGAMLRGLTAANETAALAETGLTGMAESGALLSEGLGAAVEAPALARTIATGADELSMLPRVLNWIDNAKLARSIDVGATTVLNTASEAMFEANEVKNNLITELSSQMNPDGTARYTPDQVRKIAAKAAMNTFNMNVAALSMSNLWEANLLFKKLPGKASKGLNGRIATTGLLDDAALQRQTFGRRLWSGTTKVREGILAEGFWEENIQLAIQRLNANSENFDLDFTDRLKGLAKQYATQTVGAITGSDSEASLNIGLGGLMGGMAGKVLGRNQTKELNRQVKNLNAEVSFFKKLGNIYETEPTEDGKATRIKMDDSGNPVIDQEKFQSYVASMNKVLNLNKVAENLDARGSKIMANIYRNEVFARYAKAHFDNNLGDVLFDKLNDIKNITQDDLVLLGFDPSSKDATLESQIEAAKTKAEQLQGLYNNVMQNTLPMRKDRKGRKFYDITDKLFYLSARGQALAQQREAARIRYDEVKANTDSFNEAYNRETDATVDQYNQLYENWFSANKEAEQLWYDDNARLLYEQIDQARAIADEEKAKMDQFVEGNKEVLNRLKKDARGRYLYEYANKNNLPSAKEMERMQIAQAELSLAHNATLSVMSRLADPIYGERYYDEKFEPALERQAELTRQNDSTAVDNEESDIVLPKPKANEKGFANLDKDAAYNNWSSVKDGSDRATFDEQINSALAELRSVKAEDITDQLIDDVISRTKALNSFEDKEKVRKAIKEELGINDNINDIYEAESELEREKSSLEQREDLTLEEEERLEQINDQLEQLEVSKKEAFEVMNNDMTIDSTENVPVEKKQEYKAVLNKITKDRKRVKKYDDYYEVDGKRFRKVTDIIGDVIPADQRAAVQNAINAGYTVDAITKAFFAGELNDQFRADISDKISDEALETVVKQLTKIQNNLTAKGIKIVANNVYVFDEQKEVAGEIDLLAIDKDGNFRIYEIQARRPEVYKAYGRVGKGIKIREIDQQRLSAYRNMFANQYDAVPNEIAVMFPFAVTYDKASPKGFIEKTKLKETIRFTPARSVQIKRKVFEPVRIGSKYDNIDLTRIVTNTFLTQDDAKGKMRFLMRNVKFDEIKKKAVLKVRKALPQFQERYNKQQQVLNARNVNKSGLGSSFDNFTVIPYTDVDKNKYRPSEQLKFNQGTFEAVRIVASEDLIELITAGSKQSKGKSKELIPARIARLESQLGMTAFEAYNKARELAKNNRSESNEVILEFKPAEVIRGGLTRYKGFDNLYSLAGNYELSLEYEGTLMGYLSPAQTLAYRDEQGNYKVLDDQTDVKTYMDVTGNAEQTYPEFQRISKAYKTAYGDLIRQLEQSGQEEITVNNDDLTNIFDINMSQGELDKVPQTEARPDLSDLDYKGVIIGNKKNVPTVINIDENDNIRVVMDKVKRTATSGKKLQDVDRWANSNIDAIKAAISNTDGKKVTNWVAVLELPGGEYKLISLRQKSGQVVDLNDDYITNLGDKFSSAVRKNVFKNESVGMVPKYKDESMEFALKDMAVVNAVYSTEDIISSESFGVAPSENNVNSNNEKVNNFLNSLTAEQLKNINSNFAAFPMNNDELTAEIMDDYQSGVWSSIEDYLDNLKNCKS